MESSDSRRNAVEVEERHPAITLKYVGEKYILLVDQHVAYRKENHSREATGLLRKLCIEEKKVRFEGIVEKAAIEHKNLYLV